MLFSQTENLTLLHGFSISTASQRGRFGPDRMIFILRVWKNV